ncbi:hypothetical protein HMPREF1544_07714 [Mucor circinelloides 1006PhL]|uniref:Uncharacterized protein n=1 Tax=Mucor circinelloides f. circinelloides (strain 1006PhL) TaxID=1220926 RepID=S2J5Y6_MUCC1|nr:hypothetical protein HMPREF1544_07714 [Mucor circinelloides 1006PhL]
MQRKGCNETLVQRVEALQKELDAIYKNNRFCYKVRRRIHVHNECNAHTKRLNPNTSTYTTER